MFLDKKIFFFSKNNHATMHEDWYKIADKNHFWFQWRFNIFLKQIEKLKFPKKKRLRILDIGGGYGILRDQIEKKTNWNIDLVELNYRAVVKLNSQRGSNLFYNILDKKELLAKKYDAIIMYDVLEHIKYTKQFIASAFYHLKKGGFLFLNVPANQRFYSSYDLAVGHQRRYSKKTLLDEFKTFGVKVLDFQYWGFFLLPTLIIRHFYLNYFFVNKNKIVNYGFRTGVLLNILIKILMKFELSFLKFIKTGTSIALVLKK